LEQVLLVEDDARVARFVKRGLEAEGYVVNHAPTGKDGLELARSGEHAMVIVDQRLPGLDSLEVYQALRHQERDCLIVALPDPRPPEDAGERERRDAVGHGSAGSSILDQLLTRLWACFGVGGARAKS
jgi:CheY-like chemotaxis protein